ncbi:tripartite tricarboxylate transporter permease [Rhodopseudomonas boonkerdii]|uniref:tripartite tricarboxylate transporter permease n=1 Tax=Rhodopseudomonas boonkerdii TaxID=475937 RepID=UPI001E3FE251|nr:tripartite tricarboxylate transporter permease [Rhodopseudomonas boonkerdii]UGV25737.1 tripartite tricarboxylate transporter permease [Rhodopseudomonas boonkerdii]
MLTGLYDNLALGLTTAVSFNNLLYCIIGVSLGTFIGVIPGFGTLAAMSMLFPITYHLDPTAAVIMLAGIWYGTTYGGSTASILLNLPGTPANAVTCLDGYPMSKQGRAGVALFMTTVASFFGASVGIILMMLLSPVIVTFALQFGPAEYFSMMVLGLVAASVISDGSAIKGIAMVALGLLIGTIGSDIETGAERYSFGISELMDGVSLVALAMGLFGIAEIIGSIRTVETGNIKNISMKSMLPTRDDMRRSWMPMVRGSSIGSFFGILPGTGPTVAAFMAYALEKKIAKDPSRFGKGAIEGIMAPETANNATDQTSFIPTMTLGIPGTAAMALILGVLMVHGIAPGPQLIVDKPDLFWGLVMSFWIGNILLVVLNMPLIGLWVRVLMIPYHILYPTIIMFVCIGVYTVNNSAFDVITVIIFGALGYAMRVCDFPAAPLLLGFVLGPLMEENFRRAMLIGRGNFDIFISRPLSLSLLLITAALLIWGVWEAHRSSVKARPVSTAA